MPNPEASTEYMIMLVGCPIGLDGLYRQQTKGNEHKLGSCLVEFFSRPPSAGRRLRFRPTCMKTGLELILCTIWTVDGGVNRWCTLGSRKSHPRMSLAVPSGRREGMFPGRCSEIFGLGERLGCILNLSHSFDAIEAYLWIY